MTLSLLMYAMMVLGLAAFVGILVVEARRNGGGAAGPGGRAARSSTYGRGRTQRRRECPDTAAGACSKDALRASPSARSRSRSRRRPAPQACRR